MKYHSGITNGVVRVAFESKPPDDVRDMLKRNGFRWAKYQAEWQARCWKGAADFLAALDRKMNPGKPDGACWTCGEPKGFFRPQGAATPVYCDECHKAHQDQAGAQTSKHRANDDPMGVDTLYEDTCRDQCGL